MGTYVAMLRGVNLGARNQIKMPVLAALFADLGHTDVVTYIQSGNVVFTSRARSTAALSRGIEGRIADELGLDVRAIVRSRAELERTLRTNPFLRTRADRSKLHVTFLVGTPRAALARAVAAFDARPDELRVVGRDVYLHCPGGYGKTKLNNGFLEKQLQTVATTRNWNTVNKLVELASRM